ncbi:MAG TPA: hypothetical protein VF928_00980 [Usitatibacteraceae bacterium]
MLTDASLPLALFAPVFAAVFAPDLADVLAFFAVANVILLKHASKNCEGIAVLSATPGFWKRVSVLKPFFKHNAIIIYSNYACGTLNTLILKKL